jgi:hypothetical protein
VSRTFLQIAAAVEEQSATTGEVTRNIAGVSGAAHRRDRDLPRPVETLTATGVMALQ